MNSEWRQPSVGRAVQGGSAVLAVDARKHRRDVRRMSSYGVVRQSWGGGIFVLGVVGQAIEERPARARRQSQLPNDLHKILTSRLRSSELRLNL
jgi:hypothetical protein